MKAKFKYLCPEKIQALRKALKISQNELAEMLGISPAMYCRMEKGERRISEELLEKLAVILHADLKELQSLALADKMNEAAKDYESDVVEVAYKMLNPKG